MRPVQAFITKKVGQFPLTASVLKTKHKPIVTIMNNDEQINDEQTGEAADYLNDYIDDYDRLIDDTIENDDLDLLTSWLAAYREEQLHEKVQTELHTKLFTLYMQMYPDSTVESFYNHISVLYSLEGKTVGPSRAFFEILMNEHVLIQGWRYDGRPMPRFD